MREREKERERERERDSIWINIKLEINSVKNNCWVNRKVGPFFLFYVITHIQRSIANYVY